MWQISAGMSKLSELETQALRRAWSEAVGKMPYLGLLAEGCRLHATMQRTICKAIADGERSEAVLVRIAHSILPASSLPAQQRRR